jgi:hypothetical protein
MAERSPTDLLASRAPKRWHAICLDHGGQSRSQHRCLIPPQEILELRPVLPTKGNLEGVAMEQLRSRYRRWTDEPIHGLTATLAGVSVLTVLAIMSALTTL